MEMFDYLCDIGLPEELAIKICLFAQNYNLDLIDTLTLMCNDAYVNYSKPERDYDTVKLAVECYKTVTLCSDKNDDDDYIFA